MSNSLVALSSAVVLAVYSAGYLRTQAAADRFETEAGQRRPAPPGPLSAAAPAAPPPATTPSATLETATAADTARAEATTPVDARLETRGAPTTPPAAVAPVAAATAPVAAAPSAVAPAAVTAADAPTSPAAVPVAAVAAAAAPPAAATATPAAPAKPRYKDGTFTGWGTSRHGDIQAQVIIADGRITSATIAQCMTRWPCSWIEALPGQVVTRQSPETDYVSGATQSTNAFYYAVVQALGKALAE